RAPNRDLRRRARGNDGPPLLRRAGLARGPAHEFSRENGTRFWIPFLIVGAVSVDTLAWAAPEILAWAAGGQVTGARMGAGFRTVVHGPGVVDERSGLAARRAPRGGVHPQTLCARPADRWHLLGPPAGGLGGGRDRRSGCSAEEGAARGA